MNEHRGSKRKKKSFFQRTMKFHKKGIHGKGVRIDDETFEYFLHILKVLNQDFDKNEDKRAFAENVFEQLVGNEVEYSRNQVVSRIVDNLLPFASYETLHKFMDAFDHSVRSVCTDSFASFVLQKLMSVVTQRFIDGKLNDEESLLACKSWLLKIFRYVLNNMEEFMFDHYANHVMRTVVKCIGGETQVFDHEHNITMDEEFLDLLNNFVDRLLRWSQLSELSTHNISSGFLQILLQLLSKLKSKRIEPLCCKFLNECYSYEKSDDAAKNSTLPQCFEKDSYVRLLEVILGVVPAEIYARIYGECFANRLISLAHHSDANFAVQKLIKYCPEKENFEAIFDELSNSFEAILDQGNTGVVLNLCEACVRFKTKQSTFMRLWMDCLHCNEPKEAQISVFELTLFMKKRECYAEKNDVNVNLHGSLLVQSLLKFNKPIKMVNSLLNLKTSLLVNVFSNPKGSHVADALFQSEFVGEKSREKLVNMLQGCYTQLATSKHGSRVFDTIWAASNLKNRIAIASELSENEAQLHSSRFGRPIIYNISLTTFRHNLDDWTKAQNRDEKVKKIFADITEHV